jgi:hypothetical protein
MPCQVGTASRIVKSTVSPEETSFKSNEETASAVCGIYTQDKHELKRLP